MSESTQLESTQPESTPPESTPPESQDPISQLLVELNTLGGYPGSLVCTEEGLLVASAGDGMDAEQIAGLTSLFDDIVMRAGRDMGLNAIDEVTLRDQRWGRCVIRPVNPGSDTRFFLVVRVANKGTWRRNTTRACLALKSHLEPQA